MRTPTRLLTTTALLLVVAPLAACGSADDGDADPGVPPVTLPPTGTPTTDPTGQPTSGTETPGTPPGDGAVNDGALEAIALAEAEAGGTAYEIDRERNRDGWEVAVAVDGIEIEVFVDLTGTEVLGTEREGSIDRDELDALAGATVSLADAIRTAVDETGSVLDEAEIDVDDGLAYWKVELEDDSEVKVDVATGDVLEVDRD